MRFAWLLQVAALLLAPPAFYAWRHRDDGQRALKGSALVLAGMYGALVGAFAIGEALTDPGGWLAVGGTAAWVVPAIGLAAVAWRRSSWAAVVLGVLVVGVGAAFAWSVAAPDAWTAFEDGHGPFRALAAFALAGPLAVLGWRRLRVAGLMLVALHLLPLMLVLTNVARGMGPVGWPIALVTAPAAIVGALYLVASRRGRARPTPGASKGDDAGGPAPGLRDPRTIVGGLISSARR